MDAEFLEAKKLYEEVIVDVGANPDALNMLALVEYSLGNISVAMKLVTDAATLAPLASMVRQNEKIIKGTLELGRFRSRIFDPNCDKYPDKKKGKPLIHVYQIAGNPSGGSEWDSIDLANRLREVAEVMLWTQHAHLPEIFTRNNEIMVIDELREVFPEGGTLLIAGSYHRVGSWFKKANFRRIIVLYNVVDPIGLATILEQVCLPGKPKVELLFASNWMKNASGLPGFFEPSPIDTDAFAPRKHPTANPIWRWIANALPHFDKDALVTREDRSPEFVVGRLSRDDPIKYHPKAVEFFQALAAEGCKVRLMGGTPLVNELNTVSGVQILPQNSISAVEFLRSLDCFTYRTNPASTEAWGRVVTEAMSVGLPVVVHANGGYSQLIRHGENGYLYHRDEEALELIRKLRSSRGLRQKIASNARKTILDLCSKDGFEQFLQFYLR